MKIEENISLAEFTTFKIGGNAQYFCRAKNVSDLKEALIFSKEKQVPFFVLGGGSNLLMSDNGFSGLVIKIEIHGIEFVEHENGITEVVSGAGESWDFLVERTVSESLFGLENLSAIPGTVGGAPVQNIGAYGSEAKDSISWVEVFDPNTFEVKKIENSKSRFEYRDSIFKHEAKDLIITAVAFILKKEGSLNCEYKDLKNYFLNKNIIPKTPREVRDAVVEIRSKKFPDLKTHGTAGSFFKNVIISKENSEELILKYPAMPFFAVDGGRVKIPTAWILDNICGFRGFREGSVGTFENQALVLVNYGSATSGEVKRFAEKMRSEVKEKTGIELEFEVCMIG